MLEGLWFLSFWFLGFCFERKGDREAGAGFVVGVVRDGDGAVVGLYDVMDEAEADAGTGDFGIAVAAVEALEDFGAVGLGDAGAGVGDDEFEGVWTCAGGEGDGAGGGGELEGVIEKVEKELADGEGIEGGREVLREVDVAGEGVLLLLEIGLDEGEGFGEERCEVGGLEVVELAAFFDAGEVEDVLDEVAQGARSRWR